MITSKDILNQLVQVRRRGNDETIMMSNEKSQDNAAVIVGIKAIRN